MGQLIMICRCGNRVEMGWQVKAIPKMVVCPRCAALANTKIRRDVIRRNGNNGNLSIRAGVNISKIGGKSGK